MFDGITQMFENFQGRLGKIKKKDYEVRFEGFFSENKDCIQEMFDYMDSADDKQAAAAEIAVIYADKVNEAYAKRGKIPSNTRTDLTLFMIYYVFPSILKFEREDASLLADAIRDEWRIRTNNPNMDYTTYEEIYSEFKEKLFGFF